MIRKILFITFIVLIPFPLYSDTFYTGFGGTSIQIGVQYTYNLDLTATIGYYSSKDSTSRLSDISIETKQSDGEVYGTKTVWLYVNYSSNTSFTLKMGLSGKLINESDTSSMLDWSVQSQPTDGSNYGINLSSNNTLITNVFENQTEQNGVWEELEIETSVLNEDAKVGRYSGAISLYLVVGA